MQFWPLAAVILGSAIVTLGLVAFILRASRFGVHEPGARLRWNGRRESAKDATSDERRR